MFTLQLSHMRGTGTGNKAGVSACFSFFPYVAHYHYVQSLRSSILFRWPVGPAPASPGLEPLQYQEARDSRPQGECGVKVAKSNKSKPPGGGGSGQVR